MQVFVSYFKFALWAMLRTVGNHWVVVDGCLKYDLLYISNHLTTPTKMFNINAVCDTACYQMLYVLKLN